MKILLGFLILLEVVLVAVPFQSFPIHRHSATNAWVTWKRNPSPQTEAAWKAERARSRRDNAVFDGVVIILLGLNTYGIVVLRRQIISRRLQKSEKA